MRFIASSVGEVMEIEEDLLEIGPFRRVRINLDVTKPLKQTQRIKVKGGQIIQVVLKYERLPHFFFLCGLISCNDKDRRLTSDEDREDGYKRGMHIKASPRKGLSKHREELESFGVSSCVLQNLRKQ